MKKLKALILVSGYYTPEQWRRPFLSRRVLGGIAYKPMLLEQMHSLAELRIFDIILATNFMDKGTFNDIGQVARRLHLKVQLCVTNLVSEAGGWLIMIKEKGYVTDESVIVLRSDVICNYALHLHELYAYHRLFHTGNEATMMVVKMEDPWVDWYGVIVDEKTGTVEKVGTVLDLDLKGSTHIAAGIYLLDSSVINMAQERFTEEPQKVSLERDILPMLTERGSLQATVLEGTYVDLEEKGFDMGLWEYYLAVIGDPCRLPRSVISTKSHIGPNAVIAASCQIDEGAAVENCVLMYGVHVQRGARVERSIIGVGSIIGEGASVSDMSVVGEKFHVEEKAQLVAVVTLGKNGRVAAGSIEKNKCLVSESINEAKIQPSIFTP